LNLDRLRWGEWIAAIAAINLLFVTFRAWYKVSGGGHVTAWDALTQSKYLLIATAIVGIFLFLVKATGESQQLSFKPGWITAGVGLACTVYIGYRVASPPSAALEADIGIYVGLISALGVTIGGLLSAREPVSESAVDESPGDSVAAGLGVPSPAAAGLVPDTSMPWNPATPLASTTGWSPGSPAVAAVPPATAPGAAAAATRPLRPGDHVVLTARGARHPAGTVATVVELFGGGARVEVTAANGVADRFDVPEQAYERAPAGGAANATEATNSPAAGESWSPAMPAATGDDDWGLDEAQNGNSANGHHAAADQAPSENVPWWKREIGGGKKKSKDASELGPPVNGSSNEKPSIFKRLIGGRGKDEVETASVAPDSSTEPGPDTTAVTDVAGTADAPESAVDVTEPAVESPVDEAPAQSPVDESPVDEAPAERAIDEAPAERAIDEAPAEPALDQPLAEPALDEAPAEPMADTHAATALESPIPAAEAAEPEPADEVSDPALNGSQAPVVVEPDRGTSGAEPSLGGAAAAAGLGVDHAHAQPRKRSSGSHKLPKEVLAAIAPDTKPKVGDQVELKVGGGKYDAGARGTVVDVFSAGVIVELSGDNGRTERLDVPFEAIGPADA